MRARKKKVFALAAILVLALVWPVLASGGSFLAGAAAVDITPDVKAMKVPSSGYGARGNKSMRGVHDPVKCKALVVSDAKHKAAIVTCDLIGISVQLREKVLAEVSGLGITDQNLMLTASHTHSGPGAMMKNAIAGLVFGFYNDKLTQMTADKIAAAIQTADAHLEPATLRIGETMLPDLVRNRRDPAGSYNYSTRRFSSAYDPRHPRNLTDPALTVLRFDNASGKPLAVLFHFAMHATVFGPDNMLISADWPGAAQAKIETALPGTVALYMNGAEGDQAPAMLENQITDEQYVDLIGGKVAEGVLGFLEGAAAVEAVPVQSLKEFRKVPPGNQVMGIPVPSALIRHYFPGLPLQVVRLGEAAFLACPVEMVAEIGITMKQAARGLGIKYPLVAGLANDLVLYCATPADFTQGGYEVGNTLFGEIEAAVLIGEQMLLLRQVLRQP